MMTPAHPQAAALTTPREDYLRSLAIQACIYTWPLYEMQRMRAATSARKAPAQGFAGDSPESTQRWCNLFTHERELLIAGKSRVVMPNNDTLYANAWLDLSAGPLVIHLPDTGSRYYVLGFFDYYTNPFAHLGTRTTGNAAGTVLVTGPQWTGQVPAQFQTPGRHIQSATYWVWIIGRILVEGQHDVPVVNALQDQFCMQTLSDWNHQSNTSDSPNKASQASPARRFDAQFDPRAPLTPDHFRTVVNDALRSCPAQASDALLLAQFGAVGIGAHQDAVLAPEAQAALAQAVGSVQALVQSHESHVFGNAVKQTAQQAWKLPDYLGDSFGTHLLRRAFVARQGIGQLTTDEAAYLRCEVDADGALLNGAHSYTLHFAPGELPPVDAFWSITLYRCSDYFLVANPIERYSMGDRTEGLVRDADGGLTLTLAAHAPLEAKARANWLPSCEDDFFLCLRAYLPRPNLLNGDYVLPTPQRLL